MKNARGGDVSKKHINARNLELQYIKEVQQLLDSEGDWTEDKAEKYTKLLKKYKIVG